jgi:hypothetical protein
MTPLGAATTTVSALASSGSATGTTLLDVAFGIGVAMTSGAANFPKNAAGGWLMSKLMIDQITSNAAAGNPRPMPVVDYNPDIASDEYLAHDPIGDLTSLSDSGTNALDLPAGPQGLESADTGPVLLPASPGPAGAHEGDLVYYHNGVWTVRHIGTEGQALVVSSGEPVWGSGSTITSVSFAAPGTFTVSGSPITSGAGTITLAWATQSANRVFAGPTTGSAATPTFRTLVPADLPIATTSAIGGVKAGTGLSVAGDGTLSIAAGAGLPAGSEGDLLIYQSGAWTPVAPGATNAVLVSNGTDPSWLAFHWEPLTDPSVPDLIFDSTGDVIMVPRTP